MCDAVFVDEITPGGPADKTGLIAVGDVLSKCSAVVLKVIAAHAWHCDLNRMTCVFMALNVNLHLIGGMLYWQTCFLS